MGAVIFGAIVLYLIISILVITATAKVAARKGRSGWRWGWGAALVMYLLVFWDHIPTVLTHKYYCATEAGFWVYKSVDQWKKENLGVMETLVENKKIGPTRHGDMESYTDTYSLNQQFNWVIKKTGPFLFNRWRREQEVIDIKTGEILARYVDFSTGSGLIGGPPRILKLWLQNDYCTEGESNQSRLREFRNNFMGAKK